MGLIIKYACEVCIGWGGLNAVFVILFRFLLLQSLHNVPVYENQVIS